MSRVLITAKVVRDAKFPPELLLKNSAKFIAISDDEVRREVLLKWAQWVEGLMAVEARAA